MSNTTKNININKLYPFEGHPFKVIDDEEMNALIKSIQEQGIISPIIVRPKEGTIGDYEIISGHRRVRAATKAGITEVPALIVPLDRDAAAIAVVDSNLHREHILPSEKAFAYKLKMEAMKRQGKRTDLTSAQLGRKLETAEIIGKDTNESKNQIRRYVRLTHLITPILDMVDEGRIAFTPAVGISYLQTEEQQMLLTAIEYNDCTPNLSQAQRLKKLSMQDRLTEERLSTIMCEEKANQKERISFKVNDLRKFFPKNYTQKQICDTILRLLSDYNRKLERNRRIREER